jgi:hypothetical protein
MVRVFQAGMGAGSAASAILGHAQLLAQVAQTIRAVSGRLVNLVFSNALANANIHSQVPSRLQVQKKVWLAMAGWTNESTTTENNKPKSPLLGQNQLVRPRQPQGIAILAMNDLYLALTILEQLPGIQAGGQQTDRHSAGSIQVGRCIHDVSIPVKGWHDEAYHRLLIRTVSIIVRSETFVKR